YTIVKSKQSEHRQKEPHTYPGAPAQPEWIIGFIIIPSVCRFKPCHSVNGAAWIGGERKPQFELVLIKDSKEISGILLIGVHFGVGVFINRVAAMGDDVIPQYEVAVCKTRIAD